MSYGKLALGALLFALGAVFLAIQLGYAPPDTAANVIPYWPLALIAFGIALLASALKSPALGWLAVAVIFGGVAFAVYSNMQRHAQGQVSHEQTEIDLAKLKVRSVTVRARAFAGAFGIGSAADKSRSLEFTLRNVPAEAGGGHRFAAAGSAGIFEWPRRPSVYNLAPIGADADLLIPQGMPVRIDCRGKLSSMRFDLTRLKPELCSVKGFASSFRIDLGETGHPEEIYVRGVLTSARIRIPADCPVRLLTHSRLASQRLPSDFVEHVVGRSKDRLFTADGRGRPVRIRVEGLLLDLRIERAPLSAV